MNRNGSYHNNNNIIMNRNGLYPKIINKGKVTEYDVINPYVKVAPYEGVSFNDSIAFLKELTRLTPFRFELELSYEKGEILTQCVFARNEQERIELTKIKKELSKQCPEEALPFLDLLIVTNMVTDKPLTPKKVNFLTFSFDGYPDYEKNERGDWSNELILTKYKTFTASEGITPVFSVEEGVTVLFGETEIISGVTSIEPNTEIYFTLKKEGVNDTIITVNTLLMPQIQVTSFNIAPVDEILGVDGATVFWEPEADKYEIIYTIVSADKETAIAQLEALPLSAITIDSGEPFTVYNGQTSEVIPIGSSLGKYSPDFIKELCIEKDGYENSPTFVLSFVKQF